MYVAALVPVLCPPSLPTPHSPCSFGSFQGCSSKEHWPGMFNVPVWQVKQEDSKGNTKGVWSMDYAEG